MTTRSRVSVEVMVAATVGCVAGYVVGRARARRRARQLGVRAGARAQVVIAERVRAGQHVGAAPYGYQVSGSGARRRLRIDRTEAAVVRQIFDWRIADKVGATVITRRLMADPQRFPPPRGRDGRPRPWIAKSVTRLLTNPVYTGHTMWGRTRHGRSLPPEQWVTSSDGAHYPLIDPTVFLLAQRPLRSRRRTGPTPDRA